MNNKVWKIFALGAVFTIFSGCSVENFFEVQSAMNPPRLSENQNSIKEVVKEYFKSDVTWVYALSEGRYSAVVSADSLSSENNLKIVFCKSPDNSETIHILALIYQEKKYKVIDDVLVNGSDIEKFHIIDVDKDGNKEFVISVMGSEKFSKTFYAYKWDEKGISEIDLSQETIEKLKKENMEAYK